MEGLGSRANADAEGHTAVGGKFLLKRLHLTPENVPARVQDALPCGLQFVPDLACGPLQVIEDDIHSRLDIHLTPFRVTDDERNSPVNRRSKGPAMPESPLRSRPRRRRPP